MDTKRDTQHAAAVEAAEARLKRAQAALRNAAAGTDEEWTKAALEVGWACDALVKARREKENDR